MRYVWLDLLRWVLASGVFFYHSLEQRLGDFPEWEPLSKVGGLGILPFFVISGLAISLTLSRSTPSSFVKNRIMRLLPAILFVALLQIVITAWSTRHNFFESDNLKIFLRDVAQGFVPLPNQDGSFTNFVTWTIAIEVRFYALALLLLLIIKVARRTLGARTLYIALATWIGLLYLNSYSTIPIVDPLIIPTEGPLFALGVLFGLVVQKQIRKSQLLVLFVFLIPLLGRQIYISISGYPPQIALADLLFIVISISLVFALLYIPNPKPLWAQNAFTEIGKASYSLYLLGGAFGMAVFRLPQIQVLGTPISQAATYIFISVIALTFSVLIDRRLGGFLFPRNSVIAQQ